MLVSFVIMSAIEIMIIYLFGTQAGISISLQIIGIQFIGQILAIFSLICLYLTLAMILEKQGILLALGLLGGFLGIILNPKVMVLPVYLTQSLVQEVLRLININFWVTAQLPII